MGMDVYGLNPKIIGEEPKRPTNMFTNKQPQPTKKEVEDYFEQKEKYQELNAGVYYRANVWWWRPLASLIHDKINNKEWFTEQHADALQDNSGMEWSEQEALEIRDELQSAVSSGECLQREKENKERARVSEKWNKKVQDEMDKLVADAGIDDDTAPIDYPADVKGKWDALYKTRTWDDSYPFSEDNVKRFIRFLNECGGFQIC